MDNKKRKEKIIFDIKTKNALFFEQIKDYFKEEENRKRWSNRDLIDFDSAIVDRRINIKVFENYNRLFIKEV